tara:strand:+ start:41 stop:616 length:576 start_codon:yes stop_codon:yes gene_type:complete
MYKIYDRQQLEDREMLGVIDIIINQAYEEGNGETFNNKYHPYKSPGETFVAVWNGRPAGLVSCEPSTYTGDPDIAARACRLHVLKDFRTKQIGFGLLNACYEYCKGKYKILYITHDINAKGMNAIYQKKKKSLFKGASKNPYELEAWKKLETNNDYYFIVDPSAPHYKQYIYQIKLDDDFVWQPKTNVEAR